MRDAVDGPGGIIDALARAPRVVIPLARQAPEAVRRRRPAEKKWSIHEHVAHLAEVHTLMNTRLDLMLRETNPAIRSYDPGRDEPDGCLLAVDFEEALARYETDRAMLVDRLGRLTLPEWRRTARHDEYNSYSVFTMFRHLALHDFFHAYRIEELLLRRDWPPPSELSGGPLSVPRDVQDRLRQLPDDPGGATRGSHCRQPLQDSAGISGGTPLQWLKPWSS
jgi:hypothetical protein